MIGTTFSHYKILEKIGEGGMGVVYKALDLKLDRPVALKFLPPGLTGDNEATERFALEARTASTLQHNNICTIHEIDQTPDDILFIAMDFYEGETLATKVARGPMKAEAIIDIGAQVALGLARAHERGIVHRDLKPANILMTADGVVKILDFGVAKLGGMVTVTRSGSTVGTIAYMSPEQIQGQDAATSSDLWSLGVVLFEMATGVRPFRGEHEAALMYEILNVDPPMLRSLRNDLPESLVETISRLLQKEPSRRIESAAALVAELRSAPVAPKPSSSPRSIAVLYFENMSIEKENEYFCAGITDDIITDLSKIAGLNVVSRTDVLPFRNKLVNTREVGAALGVGYILEGGVRKAGNRIRITAQLIEVRTGFHVWADRFDRLIEDIFDLQFEVSESIVKALKISLSASEKESLARKPTDDLRALDFYMRGRDFLSRRGKRNTLSAIQMFERALELDPKYASACSALAESYSNLYTFYDGQTKWLGKIIELNERTLALEPDAVDAQFGLGVVLYHQKRVKEALEVWRKVVARQPDHYDACRWLGIVSDVSGEPEAAIAYYLRCAEIKPFSEEPWMHLDMAYRQKGDKSASHEARRKMLELGEARLAINPDDVITMSRLISSYQDRGDFEKAQATIKRVLEIDPTDGLALYNCACASAQIGDKDNAFEFLGRAIANGYANTKEWIRSDPDFTEVRDDPRFGKLLEG